MASHSYKHRVDAVITGRACDPFYIGDDGTPVYRLSDDGQGAGAYISSWSPPDVSYGDQPTDAEIAAVSEVDGEAAADLDATHVADGRIDAVTDAVIAAVAEATVVDADDLRTDVVNRLKSA
jgi:hypothetical protein